MGIKCEKKREEILKKKKKEPSKKIKKKPDPSVCVWMCFIYIDIGGQNCWNTSYPCTAPNKHYLVS